MVAGTSGELCISRAMKEAGEVHDFRPRALLQVARRVMRIKWMWIGIALMTVGFFALLGMLSVENVSFVVPVTALSYVVGRRGRHALPRRTIEPLPLGRYPAGLPRRRLVILGKH